MTERVNSRRTLYVSAVWPVEAAFGTQLRCSNVLRALQQTGTVEVVIRDDWKVILWTLPADQSLTTNWKRLRSEIPAGVGVVTSEYWWMLADRDRVYDQAFSNPGLNAVDYIVLSGNGTGKPGTPVNLPSPYKNTDFGLLENHLNPRPTSFFGFRLSRSAYGFGAYVLEKTTQPQRAEEKPMSVDQNGARGLQTLPRQR